MINSSNCIKAGQQVLICLPSGGLKIAELKTDESISLGKFGTFDVNGILGFPFGQSFEILEGKKTSPIANLTDFSNDLQKNSDDEEITKSDLTQVFASAESNQDIIDIGSKVQKLNSDDIDVLKKSGTSSKIGQQIIEKIIAGHGGFDKKTVYSQQKYIRRKQQKFSRRFTIEYLGASQLLHYFIDKDLTRVLDMSEESLSLLLSYAGVKSGGRYLVIDETGGVVVYAMMERMKGNGLIVNIHENEHPNHIAMKYSNYPEELQHQIIKSINWLQFIDPEGEILEPESATEAEIMTMKPSKQAHYYRRAKRIDETNSVIQLVKNGNFDALVCVSALNLSTMIPLTLDALGGSRPIAIYSQFKETLLEAQHALSNDKRVLAPSIFETRVRPYQSIVGKMHPTMSQRGYGGYVMWGTRVFPKSSGINALGKRGDQRKKEIS